VWPQPPVIVQPPWVPHPEHPIPPTVWPNPPGQPGQPPEGGGEGDRQKLIEWKAAWSPQTGWIVVGVPNDQINVPTPSQQPPQPQQ
jgi:hypothetical protein